MRKGPKRKSQSSHRQRFEKKKKIAKSAEKRDKELGTELGLVIQVVPPSLKHLFLTSRHTDAVRRSVPFTQSPSVLCSRETHREDSQDDAKELTYHKRLLLFFFLSQSVGGCPRAFPVPEKKDRGSHSRYSEKKRHC